MADLHETTARCILLYGPMVLCAAGAREPFVHLPGGHVEPGETVLQAVHRELGEEIGHSVRHLRKLAVLANTWPRKHDTVHETMHLYAGWFMPKVSGCLPRSPEEGTRLQWATIDDLYARRVFLQPPSTWPYIIQAAQRRYYR